MSCGYQLIFGDILCPNPSVYTQTYYFLRMQVGHRTKTSNDAVYFRGDVTQFSQIQVELEMLVDGLTSPWAGEVWPKAQALFRFESISGCYLIY